jgi:hypothetical protein
MGMLQCILGDVPKLPDGFILELLETGNLVPQGIGFAHRKVLG